MAIKNHSNGVSATDITPAQALEILSQWTDKGLNTYYSSKAWQMMGKNLDGKRTARSTVEDLLTRQPYHNFIVSVRLNEGKILVKES